MNKVYSPFYTAKQYSGVMNGHDEREPVLTRVATFHCLVIGNEPASRCFLQWNPQSLPQKSGDSRGAWSVFSSSVSSLAGRKDADSVSLMPSIFSWMLLLDQRVPLQHQESTASLLVDGGTLVVTKHLPELSVSSLGFIYPWENVFHLDPEAARSINKVHSPASWKSCESYWRTPKCWTNWCLV